MDRQRQIRIAFHLTLAAFVLALLAFAICGVGICGPTFPGFLILGSALSCALCGSALWFAFKAFYEPWDAQNAKCLRTIVMALLIFLFASGNFVLGIVSL